MMLSSHVYDTIGAMSGRMEDLIRGYLILLPVLDEKGRAIIYVNCALMGEQVEEVRTRHMAII